MKGFRLNALERWDNIIFTVKRLFNFHFSSLLLKTGTQDARRNRRHRLLIEKLELGDVTRN